MAATNSTPYVKAYVAPSYLGLPTPHDPPHHPTVTPWHECYIIAVTTLLNRPLLFTVHLSSGAVYSRLPLQALSPIPSPPLPPTARVCDPWGSISPFSEVIRIDYLKDYLVRDIATGDEGRYLFSVDFHTSAFGEDPEQHKTLHMVQYEYWFGLRANNMVLFPDTHFTDPVGTPPAYRRTSTYYEIGEG